jgi:hypothetical protein
MSETIAEEMTDNEALRRILANVQGLEEGLRGSAYDDIDGETKMVGSVTFITRPANENSVKVCVCNLGITNNAHVYEDGYVVAIVKPSETYVSPMAFKGTVEIRGTGIGTSVAFSRYLKTE